ncbi:hypothetical protein EMCRGX_G013664 [Ephydatia muelleri]
MASTSSPRTPVNVGTLLITSIFLCSIILFQNNIRRVHKSFDEESQLRAGEAIGSEHNAAVVKRIVEELGGEFSRDDIQTGVATYTRTLKCVSTEAESIRRAIRARQQRYLHSVVRSVHYHILQQLDVPSCSSVDKRWLPQIGPI